MSVLFCDLVGFTPISEALDPEEVRDIQAEYFAAMSHQIERYGGTVEKYAGDAVLALFGAPIAHEDDAERAVLCALGMQEAIEPVAARARMRWGVEPALRVGVNTGEVVSGTWNATGRQDVAVTGDAVNTAARIQSVAEPGEVLAGTETMRLTRRRIQYGDRRNVTLKGKVGTVPVYPALGLLEHLAERWETSESATPLVGRERELLDLLDAWMRVQGSDGQLVTLVGDAGVGKSRLISELLERVSTSTAIRVARGRCLSYGQEISLWLIADLLRSLLGIREQDALDDVGVKLRSGMRAILTDYDPGTHAEALDVVGEVLGLSPVQSLVTNAGAQVRRQVLVRSLRLLLGAISQRAPMVVVLEDLHWIDSPSQDILTEVLSDVPGLRMLVLVAQRPGWNAPWSEWGWTERVTLRPLHDDEAALLAGSVLGGMRLSAELERYVAERAGGNPFFVEEMLRTLDETGSLVNRDGQVYLAPGAEERLPSTLTEVLLARLDRLESQVRGVAQVASVIGRNFAVRLLAEVVGREAAALEMPLSALQRAEIAFPRRGSDLEYVFKHVSMREVAYNTLVLRRRQELHLQTARAIAELYPSDEYIEMTAYHYSHTDEHAEAAGWLERAGDRAAEVYANETAIGNYKEARRRLELVGADERLKAQLDAKLGEVLLVLARYSEAIPLLRRAIDVLRREHDLEEAARVTALLTTAHGRIDSVEDGRVAAEEMIEALAWSGPSSSKAALHIALARLNQRIGRYREMLDHAEKAATIASAIGNSVLHAEAEDRRGTAYSFLGQVDEATEILTNATRLAEEAGDVRVLQRAVANLGEMYRVSGNLALARQYFERALELTQRVGDPAGIAFDETNVADSLVFLGLLGEARTHVDRAMEQSNRLDPDVFVRVYPPLSMGRIALHAGDWDLARKQLEHARVLAEQSQDRQAHEHVHGLLADLALLDGDPETARLHVEGLAAEDSSQIGVLMPALSLAYLGLDRHDDAMRTASEAVRRLTEQNERLYLVDALRAQGVAFAALGQIGEASRVLEYGLTLARTMAYPYGEGQLLEALGTIHLESGDPASALHRFKQALHVFTRLGSSRYIARTQTAIANLERADVTRTGNA